MTELVLCCTFVDVAPVADDVYVFILLGLCGVGELSEAGSEPGN